MIEFILCLLILLPLPVILLLVFICDNCERCDRNKLDHKYETSINEILWHEPTGKAIESEIDKFNRPNSGFKELPEVVVYHDPRYEGIHRRTNLNCYRLGREHNDHISSIIVVRGTWRFYRDYSYCGDYWDLSPGYYPSIGEASDVISSFQCIDW